MDSFQAVLMLEVQSAVENLWFWGLLAVQAYGVLSSTALVSQKEMAVECLVTLYVCNNTKEAILYGSAICDQ